jgi:hypothetical protein
VLPFFNLEVYFVLTFFPKTNHDPESKKHKDPRNQDPKEGFESAEVLERIS